MNERPVELVAKAIEREELHNQLLVVCEQLIMCQHGHVIDALKFIEQNKIADAKRELEDGRLHMTLSASPLFNMKKRFISLDLWIRRHGADILQEEEVEQEVLSGAAAKEAAADLEKIFGKHS